MEIKFDTNNYRIHSNKNKELIHNSLLKCGAGRSILLDNDNTIIAGNGVYEQASELQIPVRIIETDGTELIALKRTDISSDDKQRKELALFDNTTSDSSDFDIEMILKDFDVSDLPDYGLEDIDACIDADCLIKDDIKDEEPAYKLSPMVDETSQFYIIYADNNIDWLKLVSMMGIEDEKIVLRNCYRSDGSIKEKIKRLSSARIINASDFFNKIKELKHE